MRISDWSSDVCSSDLNFKLRLIGDYGFQKQQTAAAVLTGVIRTYDNGVNFANNYTDRTARLGVPVVADAPGERIVDMDGNPRYKMRQRSEKHTSELQSLMRN